MPEIGAISGNPPNDLLPKVGTNPKPGVVPNPEKGEQVARLDLGNPNPEEDSSMLSKAIGLGVKVDTVA
ncbi:MAG: hypothetical protein QME40_04540 [bacterium]|nr:hypothetical protein [bacterium]